MYASNVVEFPRLLTTNGNSQRDERRGISNAVRRTETTLSVLEDVKLENPVAGETR